MSDVVVPLTSPVHLTNIEDIHAVDLHVRYCELVKAYEQLVGYPGPCRLALCLTFTRLPPDCSVVSPGAGPEPGEEVP